MKKSITIRRVKINNEDKQCLIMGDKAFEMYIIWGTQGKYLELFICKYVELLRTMYKLSKAKQKYVERPSVTHNNLEDVYKSFRGEVEYKEVKEAWEELEALQKEIAINIRIREAKKIVKE